VSGEEEIFWDEEEYESGKVYLLNFLHFWKEYIITSGHGHGRP